MWRPPKTRYFRPAETNVWAAPYPRVDASGRVQVRINAPEATKVRVNFCSGPREDMTLWLGVGTQEHERMRQGIREFHASLTEAGIQHVYVESQGTDHEWQTWRRTLQDFAPSLFR